MVSKAIDSAPKLRKQHEEPAKDGVGTSLNELNHLGKQTKGEGIVSIQENVQRIQCEASAVTSAISSRDSLQTEKKRPTDKLSARIDHPSYKFSGFSQGLGKRDRINHQNVSAESFKIPYMERLPPYESWIHLARNERMTEDQSVIGRRHFEDSRGYESHTGICLEKSLSAALGSLDNLFCRQCIRFDCPLHGCFQPLIYPRERLPAWSEPEMDGKPCSDQCYLSLKVVKISSEDSTPDCPDKKAAKMKETDGILAPVSAEELGDQGTKGTLKQGKCNYMTTKPFTAEIDCCDLNSNLPLSDSMGKRKVTNQSDSALCDSTFPPDDANNYCKKQKKIPDDIVTVSGDYKSLGVCGEEKHTRTLNKLTVSGSTCHGEHDKRVGDGQKDATNETEFMHLSNSMEGQVDEMLNFSTWKPLEKELFLKGVEIFGRNSCLIARNLLSGLKTCMEIASYMHAGEASAFYRSIAASSSTIKGNGKIDPECADQEMPSRPQLLRKRGKTRKCRFSPKSTGLPSTRRRNTDRENQTLKQYTPCDCQGTCAKECPCHDNGNCCEKYCVCSRFCKNRFSGCHCAKSQCRSRRCSCFAAQRECDPDVCRNCWVSCGDGSLGEPPRRGDGQCGNMRSLLGQHKRILLAESDVAGWGAFSKDPIKKDDYIGEYTGELISHTEADARADSPFLFTLNDQYVIDAHRKGSKLKFANHSSSNGNCFAKMMMVSGNHRVGIFAKRDIEAGEELLYDYGYDPSVAPLWALKPEASKRGESAVSRGSARKNKSH